MIKVKQFLGIVTAIFVFGIAPRLDAFSLLFDGKARCENYMKNFDYLNHTPAQLQIYMKCYRELNQ